MNDNYVWPLPIRSYRVKIKLKQSYEDVMKEKLKKKVLKHIEKDDKEFKGQIKDDLKLKKVLKSDKVKKKGC